MTEGWGLVAALALSLALGAAFGALYLWLVWRAARGLTGAEGGAGRLVLGYAARMALVLGALALALRAGAGAPHLLAGVFGFTLLRQAVLRGTARKE
ncbi:hypothetical protein Ga0609869_002153 [Rhodovulum iodosum]|uniref:ATP synthase subunit I n=1 Tax=Rhodovulum iodosum TaxID=68291 RepID=A0ABV3XVI3_9RHOB|nr:ATP synthase subunit I [Rhodovulum robiginosum]RSK32230.1 hypothetical protein EJA01_13525 [Rhodovulum robiginosum]